MHSKQKHNLKIRAVDFRHLLLLLPFVLDNLFRDEVEEHNSTADEDEQVEDPSTELVGVANTFIARYKLYRRLTPGKGMNDVAELTGLGER